MSNWIQQHNSEVAAKVVSTKIDLLSRLQESITRYFVSDTALSLMNVLGAVRLAANSVSPGLDLKDLNTAAGISPFEIMKEHKENWSQLESLSQIIEVYFGDRVGIEAHALLHALSDEPVNELSVSEFVRKFQGLKDSGKLDFDHILAIANDPDLIPTRSKMVSAALNQLGLDMKASIRNDIAASASIRIQ